MTKIPARLLVGIAVVVAGGAGVVIANAGGGPDTPHASPSAALPTRSPGTSPIVSAPLGSPQASKPPNLQSCHYPKRRPFPDWVPNGLPLPSGTYLYRPLKQAQGFNLGLFVVKQDLQTFTRYILKQWPDAGYILGRGDAEPGEIETQFSKPPAFGAIKAQSVYCDPGYLNLYLVYTPNFHQPTISPTPASPSPVPS